MNYSWLTILIEKNHHDINNKLHTAECGDCNPPNPLWNGKQCQKKRSDKYSYSYHLLLSTCVEIFQVKYWPTYNIVKKVFKNIKRPRRKRLMQVKLWIRKFSWIYIGGGDLCLSLIVNTRIILLVQVINWSKNRSRYQVCHSKNLDFYKYYEIFKKMLDNSIIYWQRT